MTRSIWHVLVVTACPFLGLAFILLWSWHQVTVNRQALFRTEVIERNLQLLGEDLLDAETGQRGYLLTLDAAYLEPYLAAKLDVPERLEVLARLIIDPAVRNDLDRIRPLVSAKLGELATTVALAAGGQQDQALRIVTGGSGKRLMDEFRVVRRETINRERELLKQRYNHVDEGMSRLALILSIGGAAIILALLVYTKRTVSGQKRYEESLHRATQNAEGANRAKSLFLANMSHEIRTPMNAVIGLNYLLAQTALNSEQSGFVAQIDIASKSLLAVITDVLDLSKIEAGELLISHVAFSPRVLMTELYFVMRAQADLKGITLQLEVPDDIPEGLQGDAARLNQILSNLLSNAIKFTERGAVTLSLCVLGNSPAGSKLCFTVRDTGIGIDPAAQARLFTPFAQADESITRRYGGTGLGLSIISSLAKLMGAAVDFTSTVGVGSEFRVVLEFASATAESLRATQTAPASRGERPLAGVRVLVVDDYDMNRIVTGRILEQAGAQVRAAENGQVAVEQLQRLSGHFDIVLMDVQMPIMDGYEATRRIRTDLKLLDLPIIALTAGALSSERQRATAVGMDDFIIKPFDAATLISRVMQHTVSARVPVREIDPAPQTADGAVSWPEIDGIDTKDARNRLCDDPVLFRSLLERFLRDFSDIAVTSSRSVPPSLADQASRLHKLKGSAGMLGAKEIQHLAAQAETACASGDAVQAGGRSIELVTLLDALRLSAARVFESAAA